MSTVPTAPPRSDSRSDQAVAAGIFLDRRFGIQEGWLCLGLIAGDPSLKRDQPAYVPLRHEWYHISRQRRQVEQRIIELTDAGVNVYVRMCLFSERCASLETALPCAWLWQDDASAQVECTELIQTSEQSYHAWRQLEHPATVTERTALMRAWRDESPNADACSADPIHFVRIPGTLNTKRHGAFRVKVVRTSYRHYLIPDRLPPVATPVESSNWRELPDGAQLAASRRFQTLTQKNAQLHAVISGERVAVAGDTSRSAQRAVFVTQLLRAHYPHPEIRALALHFAHVLDSGRQFERDIDRLLAKRTPTDYAPEPTRATNSVAAPRGGRHRVLLADEFLDWLYRNANSRATGTFVDLSRAEIADALGVSYGTIQRLERALVVAGCLERHATPDRQRSYLVLGNVCAERIQMPCDQTFDRVTPTPDVRSKLRDPQHDAQNGEITELCEERACDEESTHLSAVDPIARVGECVDSSASEQDAAPQRDEESQASSSPAGALGAMPSLRAVVADAFSHFAGRRRVTRQIVVMFLESKYPALPLPARPLDRLIAAERDRRAWQRQLELLRAMPYAQLARLVRKVDRLLSDGPTGPEARQYPWACAVVPPITAELARREPMAERADPRRVRRRQAEERALADRAIRDIRAERQRTASRLTAARARPPVRMCSFADAPIQYELFGVEMSLPAKLAGQSLDSG